MLKLALICAFVSITIAGKLHTTPYHVIKSSELSSRENGHSEHGGSSEEAHAAILKLYSDVRPDGFKYEFDTSNHIHAAAFGDKHGNIQGEFDYISHEGIPIKLDYVADEHGYQPHSDILPTPPPIPKGILEALEYIHSHPKKEEDHNEAANHGDNRKR